MKKDKKTLQITGTKSLTIRDQKGKYFFKHPTIAKLENGSLIISGSNQKQKSFQLKSIKKVEIKEFSVKRTILWSFVGFFAVMAGISTGIYFATDEDSK
jgi:hypothetical protein